MRILALTNLFPNPLQPNRGLFNYHQLRAVAKHHDVRVLAPILWTDELSAWWHKSAKLPPSRAGNVDGMVVEHPRYYYPPKLLRNWYGHWFRASVRRCFRHAVAEFCPDLVYSPWVYPDGWAAIDLGQRTGIPVVLKALGSDVKLLEQYPGRNHRTADALRRADGVAVVSQDLAERAAALGARPDRLQVVYNGIDGDLFYSGPGSAARERLGVGEGDPIVLFVGNLVPVKGVEILIEAWGKLAAAGVRFRGYCIGDGPLRSRLEKQVAGLGLRARVQFLGPIAHDRLPDWFRAASVCALASYSEGIPNVLLEALACGTPVVATRVGGVPEIAHLGPTWLVPPGEAQALADGIRLALAPRDQDALRYPPLHSHAQAAAELVDLFERVLCGTGRRTAATSGAAAARQGF